MKLSTFIACLTIVPLTLSAVCSFADVKVDPNLKVNKSVKKKSPRSSMSYSYAGIQYTSQRLDYNPSCTQDGLNLYGSLYIQNGWFATGSFGDVSGSRCGSSRMTAGGGYRAAFNDQYDMYAKLAFESISPDGGSSDSGLMLTGGMRGFIAESIEGVLELSHSTTGDGTTAFNVGGRYWFSPELAATLDLGLSSDYNSFAIGARLNF